MKYHILVKSSGDIRNPDDINNKSEWSGSSYYLGRELRKRFTVLNQHAKKNPLRAVKMPPDFIFFENSAIHNPEKLKYSYVMYDDFVGMNYFREKTHWFPIYPASLPFEKKAYKYAAAIFTFSWYARDSIVRDYHIDKSKVFPIGAGPNLCRLPIINKKQFDGKTILFVGSDIKRKGGLVLLEAFRIVKKSIPEARLIMVSSELEPYARGRNLRELDIIIYKFANKQLLGHLYRQASVFAMPSLYEPFGVVFLEAMAYKLPCIGTNKCAMPEIIDEGKTGFLVRPKDARGLAEKIIYLLRHNDAARTMGENGRTKVELYYRWDEVVRRIEQQMRIVLEKREVSQKEKELPDSGLAAYSAWFGDQYQLNRQAFFLLSCLNGSYSDRHLMYLFYHFFGIKIAPKKFAKYIKAFSKQKLLARRVNRRLLSKMHLGGMVEDMNKFKKSRIRQPMFSGMMYPSNGKALSRQLKVYFEAVDDKKLKSIVRKMEKIRGLLVPHSNLELSGPTAAWAYKTILIAKLPKFVVILAPSHGGELRYQFSVLDKYFKTSLGIVSVERKFIKQLERQCDFEIRSDYSAHLAEHSIEIQLPFLQYVYNIKKKPLKIVPILCSFPKANRTDSRSSSKIRQEFLNALHTCVSSYAQDALVVVTGDLCHQDKDKSMRGFHKRNQELIHCFENGDAQLLRRYLTSGKYTTCGGSSFLAFLDVMAPLRGMMLDYSWSNKTTAIKKKFRRYYSNFSQIGFVSMVF